jgi:hypothetical protein
LLAEPLDKQLRVLATARPLVAKGHP